jgi:hypothetical protein
MDKYTEKNLDKIIVAIVVIIVHYIREFIKFKRQRKATSQPDYDTDDHEDYSPLPEQPSQIPTTPMKSTVATASSPYRPLPPVSTPTYRKLMITPPYPGIKKLILPAQEQDPYKLYQAASPQQTHHLNRLLNKYNTTQQAIILHEIFTPKA